MTDAQDQLQQAYDAAREMLTRYLTLPRVERVALVGALRPRHEDYRRVFVDAGASGVENGYGALWGNRPEWPFQAGQTEIRLAAAHVEDFVHRTPISRFFPGGYRQIAAWLKPGTIWLGWEFLAPMRSVGSSFDGLVALDGRFAWFPRPWKVLPRGSPPSGTWVE